MYTKWFPTRSFRFYESRIWHHKQTFLMCQRKNDSTEKNQEKSKNKQATKEVTMNTKPTLSVLFGIGLILQTVHAVTPEETEALCAVTNGCAYCRDPCSQRYSYSAPFSFSSGCGEYCSSKNGTIIGFKLSKKGLTSLDSNIGKFKDLIHLDLSYNSLKTLPNTLKSLKSLTDLYMTSLKPF